jgi:Ca2+-binding EF-hand superfamily protein
LAPPAAPANAQLDDVRVIHLARIFQMLDADHDGLLSADEARSLVAAAGLPPTPAFVEGMRARLPAAWRSRGFDFDTVVACVEERLAEDTLSRADLAQLFGLFAPAGSAAAGSTVPAHVMRHVLSGVPTTHNTQLTETEVNELFADLGVADERAAVDYVRMLTQVGGGFTRFAQ